MSTTCHSDGKCIMKHGRITREQRKSDTRSRLIAASRTVFIEKGIAAASLDNIARAAGYTRGAFYANFVSKRDLLIELLRHDHDRMLAGLEAVVADGAPEESASRVLAYCANLLSSRDCFPIWVEALVLSIRDDEIRAVLDALWVELLDAFGRCMRHARECVGTTLPATTDATLFGLLILCSGSRLAHTNDRKSVDDDMTEVLLNTLSTRVFSCRGGCVDVEAQQINS
ncbi:hypothetical protein WS97_27985 [Burkholderia territorii]|nr:hypothetical protein WS97_27985 [Burkholderia territorii]KWA24027.1 hypothetical protein WT39_23880 [Burkholderia territorii]